MPYKMPERGELRRWRQIPPHGWSAHAREIDGAVRGYIKLSASQIVTASANSVEVELFEPELGRFVPFATYRLRPGRHGHTGERHHRSDCPIMEILASEYRP